jgi:hypothetical protein
MVVTVVTVVVVVVVVVVTSLGFLPMVWAHRKSSAQAPNSRHPATTRATRLILLGFSPKGPGRPPGPAFTCIPP